MKRLNTSHVLSWNQNSEFTGFWFCKLYFSVFIFEGDKNPVVLIWLVKCQISTILQNLFYIHQFNILSKTYNSTHPTHGIITLLLILMLLSQKIWAWSLMLCCCVRRLSSSSWTTPLRFCVVFMYVCWLVNHHDTMVTKAGMDSFGSVSSFQVELETNQHQEREVWVIPGIYLYWYWTWKYISR